MHLEPESPPPDPATESAQDVRASLAVLQGAAGASLRAVILFGSRLVGSSPGQHSAIDFFVIVENYRAFYAGLRANGLLRRRPALLVALNHWLPPNVIALRATREDGPRTKCIVMSAAHFTHALSARSRDHFCKGRLAQRVELVFTRDDAVRTEVLATLDRAREETLDWVPAHLPASFTVDDFCLRMLEISYAAEIRPESRARVREVAVVQREALRQIFGPLLAERGPAHGIEVHDGHFVGRARISIAARLRKWMYFRHSRQRATLRWLKYTLTYEDWLDYIVQKIHRRTGMQIELTAAQRRLPLLLLWPKFFRVLGALRRQQHDLDDAGARR